MRSTERVCISGTGSRSRFLPVREGARLSTRDLTGVIQHDVNDQVVEAWAGTLLSELQEELARHGQCLPLASDLEATVGQNIGTIGGLIATNLPHAYSGTYGGPRDWTLGMTVVRTDGTTAKCGSKAVKNVAGYDAHRLFVGSRGTLVLIARVFLRTFPIKAMVPHQVDVRSSDAPNYVARTLATDFDRIVAETQGLTAIERASCTLWSIGRPDTSWVIGPEGFRSKKHSLEEPTRDVFDPQRKLAPGWKE